MVEEKPILMDTYENTVQSIFDHFIVFKKVGELYSITKLWEHFGNPQNTFKTIHIAGTNGKGSVSTKLAKTLTLSGYKTGLFTSPHLFSFRERFKINGECVSKEDVVRLANRIVDSGLEATYFEVVTMMGLLYFQEQSVDVAVIEVGLGGRLDSTNVIAAPEIGVITSIDYDHCEILGNTLEEIASEKAGIIKQGMTMVLGPTVTQDSVVAIAEEKKSTLVRVTGDFVSFDQENTATAKLTLEQLRSAGWNIPTAAEEEGCTAIPGMRMQKHQLVIEDKTINLVLDVGHNISGFRKIITELRTAYPNTNLNIATGMSGSKDKSKIYPVISEAFNKIYFISSVHSRLATPEQLANESGIVPQGMGLVRDVLDDIINQQENGEVLLVAGSFFIMTDVHVVLSKYGISLSEVEPDVAIS